jgi:hypothetical protein
MTLTSTLLEADEVSGGVSGSWSLPEILLLMVIGHGFDCRYFANCSLVFSMVLKVGFPLYHVH